MIFSQRVALEEDSEKVKDALSKQQLKEGQHKEKTQSLVEKAESFRVRIEDEHSLISLRDKRASRIHAHARDPSWSRTTRVFRALPYFSPKLDITHRPG